MNHSRKYVNHSPLLYRPALGVLLLVWAFASNALGATDNFLPYTGSVSGTITVRLTQDGPIVTSDAVQTVSHLGRGPQIVTQMDLTGFLDGFASPVVTVSQGMGANGDSVFIVSTLWARWVSPSDLVYSGEYQIIGGTGRFGWTFPTLTADCGRGEIEGGAHVMVTPAGEFLFQFSNSFDGTILCPLKRTR